MNRTHFLLRMLTRVLCIEDGGIPTDAIMNIQILLGNLYEKMKSHQKIDNERDIILDSHRKQALQSKIEAEKEGIVVPLTLEEYCLKPKINTNNQEPQVSS
jgi:hypothetical protein